MDPIDISSLPAGYSIPSLTLSPSRIQLFMYSAITWNRHHVHYSKDAANAEGLPDVVVHRGLLGNFLSRMISDWLQNRGEIRTINWKVISSATPDQELICTGMITEVNQRNSRSIYSLDVFVNNGKNIVALGEAVVEIE